MRRLHLPYREPSQHAFHNKARKVQINYNGYIYRTNPTVLPARYQNANQPLRGFPSAGWAPAVRAMSARSWRAGDAMRYRSDTIDDRWFGVFLQSLHRGLLGWVGLGLGRRRAGWESKKSEVGHWEIRCAHRIHCTHIAYASFCTHRIRRTHRSRTPYTLHTYCTRQMPATSRSADSVAW